MNWWCDENQNVLADEAAEELASAWRTIFTERAGRDFLPATAEETFESYAWALRSSHSQSCSVAMWRGRVRVRTFDGTANCPDIALAFSAALGRIKAQYLGAIGRFPTPTELVATFECVLLAEPQHYVSDAASFDWQDVRLRTSDWKATEEFSPSSTLRSHE